jgi:starch synthase (maltosyl-transferring)
MIRFILAATLGASCGIYGPAYELCENAPYQPGSEEYLNSEKYELKHRDLNAAWSLKEFIARINGIRKQNPALQSDRNLRFHGTDNPSLICYSKATDDLSNIIIVVVNLDSFHGQTGWVDLDLHSLGLDAAQAFEVHDLLGEGRFLWQGARNYVELMPEACQRTSCKYAAGCARNRILIIIFRKSAIPPSRARTRGKEAMCRNQR